MVKSLASRLRLGLGAIILTFTISGLISSLGLIRSSRDITKVLDEGGPTILVIDRMERSVLSQRLVVELYTNSRAAADRASIEDARRGFMVAKAELSRLWGGEKAVDAKLSADYQRFVSAQDAVCDAVADQAELLGALDTSAARVDAGGKQLVALNEELSSSESALLENIEQEVRQPAQGALLKAEKGVSQAATRSLLTFVLLSLLAIGVGLMAASLVMKGIRNPMAVLVGAMDRIASGDRSARLEDVGVAEFQPLESSFNDMAERLDEAEQGLKRSYDSQRKILDEIPVGLLTMGKSCCIDPEYSAATERIFGRQGVAGLPFSELLFSAGDSAKAKELSRYLKQLFENTTADKDFLDDMNPVRELILPDPSGDKTIAIGFDRIYDEGAVVDVLVTIEDRTEVIQAEKKLGDERLARKREADSIQAILSIGPGPLKDFFVETRDMISRIRGNLGRLDDIEVVHASFRFLHSIKGEAGSFGIEAIATIAHEAEDIFASLRERGAPPTTQELVRINVLLGTIGEELDSFESLVVRLKDTLGRLEEADAKGGERDELGELVQSLSAMVGQLEKSLGKSMEFKTDIEVESLPHLREMRQVMIHLIRNSADHGLEDEFERLFQGKPKRGVIRLSVKAKDEAKSAYLVEVEDDGQGINFERVAQIAAGKGFVPKTGPVLNKSQLLSLLFKPGFSTKETVDEISGRGVGLDLVRDTVKSLGGSIAVASVRGKGTRFTVTIPA